MVVAFWRITYLETTVSNINRYDEAVRLCERALDVDPLAAGTYYLLAHVAEERNESSKAKALLRKVLYLDPHFVPAYIELASLYAAESNAARARTMRNAALECLERLTPDARVDAYGGDTAAELKIHVETMIE